MQTAMIVLKVMPGDVDVNLESLRITVEGSIKDIYGEVGEIQYKEEPVAFGLKALMFTFIVEESIGCDPIEEKLANVENIASVQVVDFRRTLG